MFDQNLVHSIIGSKHLDRRATELSVNLVLTRGHGSYSLTDNTSVVNPEQARSVFNTAILTAILEKGPTVISLPGDVASADAATHSPEIKIPAPPVLRPCDADLNQLVKMIDDAKTVAIFGGDGCRDAHDEVVQLAGKLKAPVGYSLRGKPWLEHDNPYAVGMTGLLGYGGAYGAINKADLLLLVGTDFPFSEFLPGRQCQKVQIDKTPKLWPSDLR